MEIERTEEGGPHLTLIVSILVVVNGACCCPGINSTNRPSKGGICKGWAQLGLALTTQTWARILIPLNIMGTRKYGAKCRRRRLKNLGLGRNDNSKSGGRSGEK